MRGTERKLKWLMTAFVAAMFVLCLFPCTVGAEEAAPQVDGVEVETTDDPDVIAEHIEEHWESGTYDPRRSEYQLERLIVQAPEDIHDSCGAEDAIHYSRTDEYVLEYGTEKETKRAYDELAARYGAENVMVDPLVKLDGVSVENNTTGICWGNHVMGLDALKCESNHNHKHPKGGVTIALIDTGINAKHEMFKNRTIKTESKSFIPSKSALNDDNGHGSHVAGIIADATGAHVNFLILKVMDAHGYGSFFNMVQAIDYAIDHGAHVINLSVNVEGITTNSPSYKLMEAVLQKAHDNRVVVVAAAGNGATGGKDISKTGSYPAFSSNTIAVGSIDKKLHHSKFSYYGSALDFCAPGQAVKSAWKNGAKSYKVASGTSMATPEVAAAAAMIELYHPSYTYEQIYHVLRDDSVDLGAKGKDKYYGYGYVKLSTIEQTKIGGYSLGLRMTKAPVGKVKIKHLKKGKKKFKAYWTKTPNVTGYQLRVSRNKAMKRSKIFTITKSTKTKITVKKLKKKKKYYVQVRAYRTEKGKVVYGPWSGKKKVKTK